MSATEMIVGEDFLLPPEAFVRRCAERCGPEGGAGVTEMELAELAEAVRRGRPRLEVLDAMLARSDPTDPMLQRINTAALRREFGGNVVLDVLLRYAPGDDATFVRYAFEQIVTRRPTSRELLSLDFDLRCGRIDRRAIVNRLMALARIEGVQAVVSGDAPESGPSGGAWVTGGQTIDGQGRDLIVLVKQHTGLGWVLAPGYWHQPVETTEDGWTIRPGWVLTGPKRSLARGVWRLDVDFVQGEDATMFLDVVANAGLDILTKALFEGPTHCALRFTVADWHHFVEVRLLKPEETSEKCWIRIRNLSLAPVR